MISKLFFYVLINVFNLSNCQILFQVKFHVNIVFQKIFFKSRRKAKDILTNFLKKKIFNYYTWMGIQGWEDILCVLEVLTHFIQELIIQNVSRLLEHIYLSL